MTARLQVRDVGPYSGRAKVFKGSRVDKDKNKRRDEVKNKLGAMQQTVHDWHSVSVKPALFVETCSRSISMLTITCFLAIPLRQQTQADAKNKLKPGLPF